MTVRVDSDLRDLVISQNDAVLGVEGDKRMRTVPFNIPRYYNGKDLSGFRLQIQFVNDDGVGGCSEAQDIEVGDKCITFGWRVPNAMLAEAGTVKAALVARDADGLTVYSEYKSSPGTFRVKERLAEQDPDGDHLVDSDEDRLTVVMTGGE